jgi:hypothetical protein
MTKQPLLLRALWSALGATAYIALVASVFAFRLFGGGKADSIFTQIAALLMVVFSVLVMGTLLVMPPLRLYLDGQKTEGVRLLLFTGMWVGAFMVIALIVMAAI